jgi:hypothetical protein
MCRLIDLIVANRIFSCATKSASLARYSSLLAGYASVSAMAALQHTVLTFVLNPNLPSSSTLLLFDLFAVDDDDDDDDDDDAPVVGWSSVAAAAVAELSVASSADVIEALVVALAFCSVVSIDIIYSFNQRREKTII